MIHCMKYIHLGNTTPALHGLLQPSPRGKVMHIAWEASDEAPVEAGATRHGEDVMRRTTIW